MCMMDQAWDSPDCREDPQPSRASPDLEVTSHLAPEDDRRHSGLQGGVDAGSRPALGLSEALKSRGKPTKANLTKWKCFDLATIAVRHMSTGEGP